MTKHVKPLDEPMTADDGPAIGGAVVLTFDLTDPPHEIYTSIGWVETRRFTDEQAEIIGEALKRQFIQHVRLERAKAGIDSDRAAHERQRARDLEWRYGSPAKSPTIAVEAE